MNPEGLDPEMQRMLTAESQQAKFMRDVHKFTDICWERCMDKPGAKLDSKNETCLKNCLERFIETSQFIMNRLESKSRGADESHF